MLSHALLVLLAVNASAAARAPRRPAPKPVHVEPAAPPKAELKLVDVAAGERDPQRVLAEQFLSALTRQSGNDGLASLLGGASLVSRLYGIENWKIAGRERRRIESGELAAARSLLSAFDRERRRAHGELIAEPGPKGRDDVATSKVSAVDAAWMFEGVREKAKALEEANPVLAFVAGSDHVEQAYFLDPVRSLLKRAPTGGRYSLELDQLWVETVEGRDVQRVRRWPLWILRLRAGRLDSGFKVLPTTDTTGSSAAEVCR